MSNSFTKLIISDTLWCTLAWRVAVEFAKVREIPLSASLPECLEVKSTAET